MDLTEVADELYAVRPEEFVGRRAELAAEAKQADADLAKQVKKLAKPTLAAWVVNMLVRQDPERVQQVLDLGAALREAQESLAGDQLRELSRQRRQLTAAVTRQARAIAADLGQKVADPVATQVEETLHAAMVDADAAAAVQTGMLVKPLAVSGMEAVSVVEAVAVPEALGEAVVRRKPAPVAGRGGVGGGDAAASTRPELRVVEDDTRAVEEAEAALSEAERARADAEERLARAQRKLEKREAKGLELGSQLDELRRRIAELEERVEVNEGRLAEAEEAVEEREAAVAEAAQEVDRARKRLAELRGRSGSG